MQLGATDVVCQSKEFFALEMGSHGGQIGGRSRRVQTGPAAKCLWAPERETVFGTTNRTNLSTENTSWRRCFVVRLKPPTSTLREPETETVNTVIDCVGCHQRQIQGLASAGPHFLQPVSGVPQVHYRREKLSEEIIEVEKRVTLTGNSAVKFVEMRSTLFSSLTNGLTFKILSSSTNTTFIGMFFGWYFLAESHRFAAHRQQYRKPIDKFGNIQT